VQARTDTTSNLCMRLIRDQPTPVKKMVGPVAGHLPVK
jgi:hypothetical protein